MIANTKWLTNWTKLSGSPEQIRNLAGWLDKGGEAIPILLDCPII